MHMSNGTMNLTKFLSQAGIASRRQVVEYIKQGSVRVNGTVQIKPSYLVQPEDVVTYKQKRVVIEKKFYVLLNKPTDYITTVSDEKGRKTVMDLLGDAFDARLYPVGRLDAQTTGLLLLTNDGDLAQRLAHPKYEVSKVYQVELNMPLTIADFQKIKQGLALKDGPIAVDEIAYIPKQKHTHVIVRLHSGKNRIVRRIFEHLKYRVEHLDRIEYAGLTKKGLRLGSWRQLTQKEIDSLRK